MRNVFASEGREASLGRYAFGFSWGSWAALLISTILFCLSRHKRRDRDVVAPATTTRTRRTWPWKRRGTTRSYDGRRVKEEYA
jgi:hypothetical protein